MCKVIYKVPSGIKYFFCEREKGHEGPHRMYQAPIKNSGIEHPSYFSWPQENKHENC